MLQRFACIENPGRRLCKKWASSCGPTVGEVWVIAIEKTCVKVTVRPDQPREQVTYAIDDPLWHRQQAFARRNAKSAQSHRKIECEPRIVAPIRTSRIDVNSRRRTIIGNEPTIQPMQRRFRARDVRGL